MVDFSNLSVGMDPTDVVREYVFEDLPNRPVLHVTHAGDCNKPYVNDLNRLANKTTRGRRGRQSKFVEAHLESDKTAYPKFGIVRNWGRVMDVTGADVLFTVENCREFLSQIPTHEYKMLRVYCDDIQNFIDPSTALEDEELEEIAGN